MATIYPVSLFDLRAAFPVKRERSSRMRHDGVIADLIHNRFSRIYRVIAGWTEFFCARSAEQMVRLAVARVGTPSLARTAETW